VTRFYFHLFNDMECRDEEGAELPNAAVALQRASVLAREMAAESVKQGHLVLDHRIDVSDDRGAQVGTVHFRDVVVIKESDRA
jgi:hypothetical protein